MLFVWRARYCSNIFLTLTSETEYNAVRNFNSTVLRGWSSSSVQTTENAKNLLFDLHACTTIEQRAFRNTQNTISYKASKHYLGAAFVRQFQAKFTHSWFPLHLRWKSVRLVKMTMHTFNCTYFGSSEGSESFDHSFRSGDCFYANRITLSTECIIMVSHLVMYWIIIFCYSNAAFCFNLKDHFLS